MRRVLEAAWELALVLGGLACYQVGRTLADGQRSTAVDHAELVRHAEAWLHLPSEAAVQAAVGSSAVYWLADAYYGLAHYPAALVFLIWGCLRRPREEYRWARNLLALTTAGGLVLHFVFPLAPPRMFPGWGFVDTMATYGPMPYGGGEGATNEFAAMPSLHVGWAVLIAYVVARTGPRLAAVVTGVYAALTLLVVVVTANHWWLDTVVGISLVALAGWCLPPPRSARDRSAGDRAASASERRRDLGSAARARPETHR